MGWLLLVYTAGRRNTGLKTEACNEGRDRTQLRRGWVQLLFLLASLLFLQSYPAISIQTLSSQLRNGEDTACLHILHLYIGKVSTFVTKILRCFTVCFASVVYGFPADYSTGVVDEGRHHFQFFCQGPSHLCLSVAKCTSSTSLRLIIQQQKSGYVSFKIGFSFRCHQCSSKRLS